MHDGAFDSRHLHFSAHCVCSKRSAPEKCPEQAQRAEGASSNTMFYIYILECEQDRLYVGSCEDIKARFIAHRQGLGAEYTRRFKPVRIAFTESFETRAEAMSREAQVKRWSRAKKQALIENNTDQLKHLSKSND